MKNNKIKIIILSILIIILSISGFSLYKCSINYQVNNKQLAYEGDDKVINIYNGDELIYSNRFKYSYYYNWINSALFERGYGYILTRVNTMPDGSGTDYYMNASNDGFSSSIDLYVMETMPALAAVAYDFEGGQTYDYISSVEGLQYTFKKPANFTEYYTNDLGFFFLFYNLAIYNGSNVTNYQFGDTITLSQSKKIIWVFCRYKIFDEMKVEDPDNPNLINYLNTHQETSNTTVTNNSNNKNTISNNSSTINTSQDTVEEESKVITINSAESLASKDIFDSIKGTDKSLTVTSGDNYLIFNGSDIGDTKDIDGKIELTNLADNKVISKKIDSGVIVHFADNGDLPGKATVYIHENDITKASLDDSKPINLYYNNEETNTFDLIASDIKKDENGYYVFEITHNSDYILTNSEPVKEDTTATTKKSFNLIYLGLSIACGILAIALGVCIFIIIKKNKNSKKNNIK